jgi:xanthine dehydrogenase YagS FAD-binding subunit
VIPFTYERATGSEAAVHAGAVRGAKFLAGGTNLVDLMKDGVEQPTKLVDVNHVGFDQVASGVDGLVVGAGVKNSDLANHKDVVAKYPLLSHALLAGASAQLRNLASTGGNLMQRTRCYYFMDTTFPACNKRMPGTGCAALEGYNRIHAILGQTDEGPKSAHTCIATNPSDMSVALYALDAKVEVMGPKGKRTIAVREFHRLVGDDPSRDTELRPDELITAVVLPAGTEKFAANSWYLKARDRQSYAFALVSVAVGLEMEGETVKSGGIAMGGVAHKPWHLAEAEAAVAGKPATEATFGKVAEILLRGAKGYHDNAFKVELAKSCVVRACMQAAGLQRAKGTAA